MDTSVKQVFEDECRDLVIDNKLIQKINSYKVSFTNKNDDHITFFGGNLLGVQVVRFMASDRDLWFDEILQVNDVYLEQRLKNLPKINPEFKISSDTMNLSCVWLIHAIFTSPKLTEKQKAQGMVDVACILQFKFFTSILYRFFKYPAEPEIAAATYAQLSYKYLIKTYGSWNALFQARSEDIVSRDSIHYRAVSVMDDDDGVTGLLNDTQTRLRDMVKNIYGVMVNVKNQGIRIKTTSAVMEYDGESILRDRSRNIIAYNRYIHSIITDKASFIREELCGIIEKRMHTMSPKLFRETLAWMSNNYNVKGAGIIDELLNDTLVHAFDYLSQSQNLQLVRNTQDIPGMLNKLRGAYMSSRSTDELMLSLREKAEKVVRDATGSKHPNVVASVRTGLLLYIVLRSLTMKHYSSSAS